MPDAIFAARRLAEIYDPLDPDRGDLDLYLGVAAELGACRVLDVGCGTGTFACLLSQRGVDVTGVDPAAASLDVARTKPGADLVRWLHGDATSLPLLMAAIEANPVLAPIWLAGAVAPFWMERLASVRFLSIAFVAPVLSTHSPIFQVPAPGTPAASAG